MLAWTWSLFWPAVMGQFRFDFEDIFGVRACLAEKAYSDRFGIPKGNGLVDVNSILWGSWGQTCKFSAKS